MVFVECTVKVKKISDSLLFIYLFVCLFIYFIFFNFSLF